MSWNLWRRRLAEGTEPDDATVRRVRARIDATLAPTTALLRATAPEPSDVQVARVHARLRRLPATARPRPVWPLVAGPALALALGAALLVARAPEAPPALRTVALAGLSGPVALSDIVEVTPSGEGTAHGADRAWTVAWEAGTLGVAVVPRQSAQVEIDTREARVRVIGTRFTVDRDALGTRVVVTEGRVAVDCADGASHELIAGGDAECLPTTDAGLLGRALAQSGRGDAPDAILATLDRGLAVSSDPEVGAELRAAEIDPLLALGRTADARDAAEQYLSLADAPRADEIRRVAGRLALLAGDCASAARYLGDREDLSSDESAWLARCGAR